MNTIKVTHHDVARALNASEIQALKILELLHKKRIVEIEALPLDPYSNPKCSTYYKFTHFSQTSNVN